MYNKISSMLDKVANSLEAKGFLKEAYELDKIADELGGLGKKKDIKLTNEHGCLLTRTHISGLLLSKVDSFETAEQIEEELKAAEDRKYPKRLNDEQLRILEKYFNVMI